MQRPGASASGHALVPATIRVATRTSMRRPRRGQRRREESPTEYRSATSSPASPARRQTSRQSCSGPRLSPATRGRSAASGPSHRHSPKTCGARVAATRAETRRLGPTREWAGPAPRAAPCPHLRHMGPPAPAAAMPCGDRGPPGAAGASRRAASRPLRRSHAGSFPRAPAHAALPRASGVPRRPRAARRQGPWSAHAARSRRAHPGGTALQSWRPGRPACRGQAAQNRGRLAGIPVRRG